MDISKHFFFISGYVKEPRIRGKVQILRYAVIINGLYGENLNGFDERRTKCGHSVNRHRLNI